MSEHQPDSPRFPCEKQAGLCPSQSSTLGGQLALYQKQGAREGGCVVLPAQIQYGEAAPDSQLRGGACAEAAR